MSEQTLLIPYVRSLEWVQAERRKNQAAIAMRKAQQAAGEIGERDAERWLAVLQEDDAELAAMETHLKAEELRLGMLERQLRLLRLMNQRQNRQLVALRVRVQRLEAERRRS